MTDQPVDDPTTMPRLAPNAAPSAELAAWAHTILCHRISRADEAGQTVLLMLREWAKDGDADYYINLERARLANRAAEADGYADWIETQRNIIADLSRRLAAAEADASHVPADERRCFAMVREIEASGLLANEWRCESSATDSPIMDATAAVYRRRGQERRNGTLTIAPHDPDGYPNYRVRVTYLPNDTTLLNWYTASGPTAVEALVDAINKWPADAAPITDPEGADR